MLSVTFINYDEKHRKTTKLDHKTINTHVAKVAAERQWRSRNPAQRPAQPRRKKAARTSEEHADEGALAEHTLEIQNLSPSQSLAVAHPSPERLPGAQLDPFDAFRAKLDQSSVTDLNYFCGVFGPYYATNLPSANNAKLAPDFLFSLAVDSDIVLEGMRGFTLCSTFDCSKRDTPKAREVWYHRTNAIKGLQPRLVSPQLCADDASIQTVMTLVTIDTMLGELQYIPAHLSGLRRMVRLRGGMKSPQLSAFLKQCLLSTFAIAGRPFTQQPLDSEVRANLHYPTHPFPWQLSELISRLPIGFAEVALTKALSVETIEILGAFQAPLKESSTAIELLHGPIMGDLTPLESCICFALARYRQRVARVDNSNFVIRKYMQVLADIQVNAQAMQRFSANFSESLIVHHAHHVIIDCLAWVAVVVGTMTPVNEADDDRPYNTTWLKQLTSMSKENWDWKKLQTVVTGFFHDQGLIERGEQVWNQLERQDCANRPPCH